MFADESELGRLVFYNILPNMSDVNYLRLIRTMRKMIPNISNVNM